MSDGAGEKKHRPVWVQGTDSVDELSVSLVFFSERLQDIRMDILEVLEVLTVMLCDFSPFPLRCVCKLRRTFIS